MNRASAGMAVRVSRTAIALGAFVIGVSLAGAGSSLAETVKIATNQNLLNFPVKVAKERGLFKKYNIDAELVEIVDGTALRTALLTGAVNFVAQAAEGSAVLNNRGAAAQNVVALQGKMTYYVILSAKHKGQFAPGDIKYLKGMTMGVSSRGSGSDIQLQAMLKANGLKPNTDVKIVGIGTFANGIAAMDQSRIDGLMCVEPACTPAFEAGNVQLVDFTATEVYPGASQVAASGLGAMKEYIDANPDLVRRVVAALVDAQTEMVANPEWTIEYAARLSGQSVKSVGPGVRQHIAALNPAFSESGWNTLMNALVDAGVIKAAVAYAAGVAPQYAAEWAKFKR